MEEKVLIEAKNLKKYFKVGANSQLHAVDGVNFKIKRGTTLGVVGESGCGKSTLGRLLLRLYDATDGQIIYDGTDITKLNAKELKPIRARMQMIFQDPSGSLDPRKSVKELIGEPLKIYKACKNRDEYDARIAEIMETVGLDERYAESFSHELDGGRRQRIGIGRALAMDPEFIICDEPVSALDVSIQAQVINLFRRLQTSAIEPIGRKPHNGLVHPVLHSQQFYRRPAFINNRLHQRPRHHPEAAGSQLCRCAHRHDRARHLLHQSRGAWKDRERPHPQHRWPLSGTSTYLQLRNRKRTEDLYRLRRHDDKKYRKKSRSSLPGIRRADQTSDQP